MLFIITILALVFFFVSGYIFSERFTDYMVLTCDQAFIFRRSAKAY